MRLCCLGNKYPSLIFESGTEQKVKYYVNFVEKKWRKKKLEWSGENGLLKCVLNLNSKDTNI